MYSTIMYMRVCKGVSEKNVEQERKKAAIALECMLAIVLYTMEIQTCQESLVIQLLPTTSISKNDCEITMAVKVKPGTRNCKGRSAICWQSRFKTSAVYKREGRAWP